LANESGDTAFAVIPSGMDSICLDRKEGNYPVKALMMNPGRRRPLGIGAGSLALLSAMSPELADQILSNNAARIREQGDSDIESLRLAIQKGRIDGHVLREPLKAPEILSLGVAVCNPYGTPVMSLSISALKFRIEQRQQLLQTYLRQSKLMAEERLAKLHMPFASSGSV
jgi:DNA-binding IclR family transcriptional regulator